MKKALRPLFGVGIGLGAFFLMGSNALVGDVGTALTLGLAFGVTLGLRPKGDASEP